MSGATSLPVYFFNPDYQSQEYYHELFNRILRDWFSTDIGFFLPSFTSAEITVLLALDPPVTPCRIWFNSDLGKMQLLVAPGVVETVTSV